MDTGPRALAYQDGGEVVVVLVLDDDEERDVIRELGWKERHIIRVTQGIRLRIQHQPSFAIHHLP